MDSLVFEHLDASDRNLTIATDMMDYHIPGLSAPAYEWIVVVCFYSAVRCVNAYLLSAGFEAPRSHVHRLRYFRELPKLRQIFDDYGELDSWSRAARYTHSSSDFDQRRAQNALDSAQTIRDHIDSLIPDDS